MVDRLGQQRRQRLGGLGLLAGRAASDPAWTGRPGRRPRGRPPRPAPTPPGRRGSAGGAAAATPPGRPPTRVRCRSRAPRPAAARPAPRAPSGGLGGEDARQLGSQRVLRLPRGIAYADQAGHPARLEPGAGQGRPPVGHVCARPTRRRRRWAATPARARCRRRWRAAPPPRPASTSSAAVGSSTCSRAAAALSSRTPRPPLRSALGGAVPQWSSSSSTRRTASNAAPAAARSTSAWSRAEVAISGAGVDRLARGAATAQRQRRPRRAPATTPPARGTSSLRASSSSAGVAASSGSTVCRADPAVAWPPLSSTCSQHRRAPRRRARPAAGPPRPRTARPRDTGCSPLTPGRGAAGEPLGDAAEGAQPTRPLPDQRQVEQPVQRALDNARLGVHHLRRLPSAGFDPRRRGHQGQRARAASAGRARGQPRTGWRHATPAGWSREGLECRDRDARGAGGRAGRRTTLAAGRPGCGNPRRRYSRTSLPRYRAAPPTGVGDEAGRAAPRRRHRRRPGPRGQRGRLPRRAAGLRRRRRHGRPRRRRRRQRDRRRGVRPAGRRRLRPAARRRRRRGHARAVPAPDRGVRRAAGQQRPAPVVRRHHRGRRPAGRGRRRPTVAARQPRRLPDLPVRRRRARAGQRRPQRRAGADGGRRRSPATTPPPIPSAT